MKTFAVTATVLWWAFCVTLCFAAQTPELQTDAPVIGVDWQVPQALPRRFRNHCVSDPFSGHRYCSDHCGSDYQFYFCSRELFGCCRVGFGYCDWNGLLRCHP